MAIVAVQTMLIQTFKSYFKTTLNICLVSIYALLIVPFKVLCWYSIVKVTGFTSTKVLHTAGVN